ncbi:hypothetical protein ABPG74_020976 [Tetrahymena malaccensis]
MILVFIFISSVICEGILQMEINSGDQTSSNSNKITLLLGTPPVSQQIIASFTVSSSDDLGQFIIDSSIQKNDPEYYENQVQPYGITLYDMHSSLTAQIGQSYQSNTVYGGYFVGNIVNDVMTIGNKQFQYQFPCVVNDPQPLPFQFLNGQTIFNRSNKNYFDYMIEQNVIQNSDYLLQKSQQQNSKVDIVFDLENNNPIYSQAKNPLEGNSQFNIKFYGIYANNQDISDKLKNRIINFDMVDFSQNTFYIPMELKQMYFQNLHQYDLSNCVNCQCQIILSLPTFKFISQEYIFEITPSMYTNYQKEQDRDGNVRGKCKINAMSFSKYNFASYLIKFANAKIMYSKETNSLRFDGIKKTKHMNLDTSIVIISSLNSVIFALLLLNLFNIQQKQKLLKGEISIKSNILYKTL